MLKLTQFHISGTVISSDTVTYQAVDKTTGLPVFIHFLPKSEVRYRLQSALARYVEACHARRLPVTLAIDEKHEFIVSPPLDNFAGLGSWMEQQILTMRVSGLPEANQEKTLDLSWLKQAEAMYDQPVSTASQFGFRPLPAAPPTPVPPPVVEPQEPAPVSAPPRSTLQRWLGPGVAILLALSLLIWVIAAGSSR